MKDCDKYIIRINAAYIAQCMRLAQDQIVIII